MIIKLGQRLPKPIRESIKKALPEEILHKWFKKDDFELAYQERWAKRFSQDPAIVERFWNQHRFLNDIKQHIDITTGRVLDVGCGISTALHFIGSQQYGLDPLAEQYKKLYSYPAGINIITGTGEGIPFESEHFDMVINSNVLDHVENPEKTINEIHRVLKPGGHFLLTVEVFSEQQKRDLAHPHCLDESQLNNLLKDKFDIKLSKQTPWIGLWNFERNDDMEPENDERIILARKKPPTSGSGVEPCNNNNEANRVSRHNREANRMEPIVNEEL